MSDELEYSPESIISAEKRAFVVGGVDDESI